MNKTRRPYVTKICSDTCNPELLCLGMSDGTVYYYDLRIPSGEKQRIMSLLGLTGSVVGLSTFSSSDSSGDDIMSIVAGSDSGDIRIWDPRMYEEPLTEFNVCSHYKPQDLKMLSMDVQNHGKLIACATTVPEVLVYDKEKVKLRGVIKYDDALIGGRLGAPSAVRFHPLRVMLAVSTEERMVSAYGLPHSVL